ncbi:septal ring lytic transglycosylase RlpA family protein [Longibacter sp.]|uniref:septal ring lytic transglycosylase RlpA family protein n=1 Tax=Longibacter sp. TaxID=2045415 RepID=UPI003EBF9D97
MMRRTPLVALLVCLGLMVACATGTTSQTGKVAPGMTERGEASYYADKFVGRQTASGDVYTHRKLTAAHRTLPFGTRVRVTRLDNGKQVTVRINDRGPFKRGRIIDLSKSAAKRIDLVLDGVADVKIEVMSAANRGSSPGPEPDRTGDSSTSW